MPHALHRKDRKLAPRQERFVQEYTKDLNGTRAAARAGYSVKTANEQASRLLAKVSVASAIASAKQSVAEQAGVEAVDALRLAKQFAFLDPGLLVDEEGAPLSLDRLPPEVRLALQGVDIVPTRYDEEGKATAYSYRYQFVDKNSALDKLFRHLGLYEKETRQADGGVRALMEAVQASGTRLPLKT